MKYTVWVVQPSIEDYAPFVIPESTAKDFASVDCSGSLGAIGILKKLLKIHGDNYRIKVYTQQWTKKEIEYLQPVISLSF